MLIRVTYPVDETYTSAGVLPSGEYTAEKARSRQLSDRNGRPADGWWVYGEGRKKYSVMDYDWNRAVKSGAIEEIKEGEVSNLPAVTNDENMSIERLKSHVQMVQHVMKEVMQKDEHFGIIPGCKKPSLWKPGAEKLSLTFRLAPYYEVTETDQKNDHKNFVIKCILKHIGTGNVHGEGVGSCSTMESKYRFKDEERKCPKCGKESIIKGKEEFGGGWVCFRKKGGCNAKFADGDTAIEGQRVGRVEYDNPADFYNTALKMAKKRAHIDATLTATAASDIFTQDIEDMVDNGAIKPEPNMRDVAAPQPSPKPNPKAEPTGTFSLFVPTEIEMKEGVSEKTGKPWKQYIIYDGSTKYRTFDSGLADLADEARNNGSQVRVEYKSGKYGHDITALDMDA